MARDTDKDWEKIAEENPYWGVLSVEEFRGQELSLEQRKAFFQSGETLINNLVSFVRRHIAADFRIRRALDFGCGVGRLLIPLCKLSKEAVGIDIAPQMLAITRQNLVAAGIKNGTVVQSDDNLSKLEGSFSFVNSYIVLQHIPPERGMKLIKRLLDVLEIGGVFSLQLTYAKERRFFMHFRDHASYFRQSGQLIQDLLPSDRTNPDGTITMFDYDMNEVMLAVSNISGEPILMLPTNHDGHIGIHIIGQKAR